MGVLGGIGHWLRCQGLLKAGKRVTSVTAFRMANNLADSIAARAALCA